MISDLAKWMIDHPSSIREIMNLVAEFRKHPEKFLRPLIYLAGGWPQDPPPEVLKEKALEVLAEKDSWIRAAQYSPTLGYPDIREAVVNYEERIWGRKINAENVVFGLGSTEQTGAIFLSLLNPGDEVIFTSPGYLNYIRQLELELGKTARPKFWKIIRNGRFEPDLDELQNMITSRTKLILLTSPGNPDGQVWSDEMISALYDIAEDKKVYVAIDLAYRAFIFKEKPRYLSKTLGEYEIFICSLSKELRTPGWRASYLIVPPDLVRAIETIEQARTLAPSSPIQVILTSLFNDNEALRRLADFYEAGRVKYRNVAEKTVSLLKEIENIYVLDPEGGFYVFFDVSKYNPDSKKVWMDLIKEYQVALAPGVDFNGFDGWLRLSFAPVVESTDKLYEGIARIREFFEKSQSRK
ncbi:MAG: pyridoxal phosphate-dependent aminotransferase [Candidatus Njordarchaeales archaeon]